MAIIPFCCSSGLGSGDDVVNHWFLNLSFSYCFARDGESYRLHFMTWITLNLRFDKRLYALAGSSNSLCWEGNKLGAYPRM